MTVEPKKTNKVVSYYGKRAYLLNPLIATKIAAPEKVPDYRDEDYTIQDRKNPSKPQE